MATPDRRGAGEDRDESLDAAHREIQDMYPELAWDAPGSRVNAAVSRALEMGFEIGRDFGNRYPD
jgi:hypothetical protein